MYSQSRGHCCHRVWYSQRCREVYSTTTTVSVSNTSGRKARIKKVRSQRAHCSASYYNIHIGNGGLILPTHRAANSIVLSLGRSPKLKLKQQHQAETLSCYILTTYRINLLEAMSTIDQLWSQFVPHLPEPAVNNNCRN